MRRAVACSLALASTVAACLLPELGNLSGSSGDAGAADATGDAANDGFVIPVEGGVPCADASFCDDFDHGALGATWSSKKIANGGALALDVGGQSAPNVLKMVLSPPPADAGGRAAALVRDFTIPASLARVRCAVSVRLIVRTTAAGDDYELLAIGERAASGASSVAKVKADPTNTRLISEYNLANAGVVSSAKNVSATSGGIVTGTWTRLTLEIDYGAKAATLTIAPSGGSPTTQSFPALNPSGASTTVTVTVGDPNDGDVGSSTTQFDDYACTLIP